MEGRKIPNSSEEAVADSVTPQRFAFGAFILDMQRGTLTCEGRRVAIGHKGLLLLHALVRASTQIVSKAALMEAAWPAAIVEESNLSVQIAAIRKMLGPQPEGSEWIATVPRAGYRFAGRVNSLHPASCCR